MELDTHDEASNEAMRLIMRAVLDARDVAGITDGQVTAVLCAATESMVASLDEHDEWGVNLRAIMAGARAEMDPRMMLIQAQVGQPDPFGVKASRSWHK